LNIKITLKTYFDALYFATLAYARGKIIRGGAAAWEGYSAKTAGFILEGDGTDIISKQFDWDDMAAGVGADMVHSHASDAEGGILAQDAIKVSKLVASDGAPDPAFSSDADGNCVGVGWVASKTWGFVVKNTSGAASVVGDVGYIDVAGEYKTTTTAQLSASWCVALTAGANNADIYVTRRGRVNVNYAGAAPSTGNWLVTSTTAGALGAQTTLRPEIFAVCLGNGAGGVVSALLLTDRTEFLITNSNDIFRCYLHSTFNFIAKINSGGSGGLTTTNVPYDTLTGSANTGPYVTTQLGKLVLYNTTRSTVRLITAIDSVNSKITTLSTADAWADNDDIKLNSINTTGGGGEVFYTVDLSNSTVFDRAIGIEVVYYKTDSGAIAVSSVHPDETYAASKENSLYSQNGNYNTKQAPIPLLNKRFSLRSDASGVGTSGTILRVNKVIEATP
jgi:hypothetical protein